MRFLPPSDRCYDQSPYFWGCPPWITTHLLLDSRSPFFISIQCTWFDFTPSEHFIRADDTGACRRVDLQWHHNCFENRGYGEVHLFKIQPGIKDIALINKRI